MLERMTPLKQPGAALRIVNIDEGPRDPFQNAGIRVKTGRGTMETHALSPTQGSLRNYPLAWRGYVLAALSKLRLRSSTSKES